MILVLDSFTKCVSLLGRDILDVSYVEVSVALLTQNLGKGADDGAVDFEDAAITPNLEIRVFGIDEESGEIIDDRGHVVVGGHRDLSRRDDLYEGRVSKVGAYLYLSLAFCLVCCLGAFSLQLEETLLDQTADSSANKQCSIYSRD